MKSRVTGGFSACIGAAGIASQAGRRALRDEGRRSVDACDSRKARHACVTEQDRCHEAFSLRWGPESKTAREHCHRAVRTACTGQQAGGAPPRR